MKSLKTNSKKILAIKSEEVFHSSVGALALSAHATETPVTEDDQAPLVVVSGKRKTMPVLKLNFNDPDSAVTITNHASHASHSSHSSHHSHASHHSRHR